MRRTIYGALGVASAAYAIPALARDVAYEADSYTVYLEEPQYCTMYLDTDRESMIRFSYRRTSGEVYFSFVRQGFPVVPPNRSFPVHFQFDGSPTSVAVVVVGYEQGGRTGFSGAIPQALLERWGKHSTVNIRLGDTPLTLIEAIPLRGSGQAVRQLMACTLPGYSVTVEPPPPEAFGKTDAPPARPSPKTALGPFAVRCARNGASAYYVGQLLVGEGLPCDESGKPEIATTAKFDSGEEILLVTKPVSMTVSAGSIIYVKPGRTPRVINIDYMTEFGRITAPNKVQVRSGGQLERTVSRQEWMCELTIDWRTAKIISQREIRTQSGMCR